MLRLGRSIQRRKPAVRLDLLVAACAAACLWPACGQGREEGAFQSLETMIGNSGYVAIATIEKKSPKLYADGWVEYRCRFLYWLKRPSPLPKQEGALLKQEEASAAATQVAPVPLYTLDEMPFEEEDVLLVDSHEKSYHRLLEAAPIAQRAQDFEPPLYNTYVLLFLNKNDDGKGYVTVGTRHSILPVSPLLDISRLPSEPHRIRMDLAPAQSRVKMTTAETVRHILRDYLAYKKEEWAWIHKDLDGVLKAEQSPAP
jgi:hypothetical protein